MKSVAQIAAAACAIALIASPVFALAEPIPTAAMPAATTYQFVIDDAPFGCQFHDEKVMPAAYAKAIDVALKHAGFTYREVEIDDVYVFDSPTYDEPLLEVEFQAGALDCHYIVGLNTLNVDQWFID